MIKITEYVNSDPGYGSGYGYWDGRPSRLAIYRPLPVDSVEIRDWLTHHGIISQGFPKTFEINGDLEVLFKLRFL